MFPSWISSSRQLVVTLDPFRDDRGEPFDFRLRVNVSRSMSLDLDTLAAELRLSKSMLVREALRRGLPALVTDVEHLRALGFRPSRHLAGVVASTSRRGAARDSAVAMRWSRRPGGVTREEPVVPPPVEDED